MTGVARPHKQKRPGHRKHSFGGCRTCRRRHVKCDQVRPSCLACRAVNAVCEGYASEVRWMPTATVNSASTGQSGADDGSNNATRYHLYSEATRKSMSRALISRLGSKSVDASLAEIDAKTTILQDVGTQYVAVGPFGILNVEKPVLAGAVSTPDAHSDHILIPSEVSSTDGLHNPTMQPDQGVTFLHQPFLAPSVNEWFDPVPGFDDTLHWADLFGLDFDNDNSTAPTQVPGSLDFFSFGRPTHEGGSAIVEETPTQTVAHSEPAFQYGSRADNASQDSSLIAQLEQKSIALCGVQTVDEAQYLLKNFHDALVPQMAFLPPNHKSPWNIIQMPRAMHTLAELSYLQSGKVTHANAANLFAILACSAYHLAVSPSAVSEEPTEKWKDLFDSLRQRASFHMKESLQNEVKGPPKAKYKDQLMAILSMLALTSISGAQRDARFYMIDAERLLRVRGLAKRDISRRCRLLHHVYTWIRIVGESTYVLHDYQGYGPVVDNMSAAFRANREAGSPNRRRTTSSSKSGHNARLDDFLRLDNHSSDSDLEIEEDKEHDEALFDIHLEDSRRWGGTLYHVYGISETWLSLVSQTTRLANILDAAKYGKATDMKFLEFLQKRAGRLENIICSFALKDPGSDDEDGAMDSPGPNHYMLRAMNSALVILFYRRVRNVNPLILQGHVDSVVQSLKDFDSSLASIGAVGPGSAWPAFIAGCEAQSRRNRRYLLHWLEQGFEKCGLEYFGASRHLMVKVWERQDEPTPLQDPGSGSSTQSRQPKLSSCHQKWVDLSRETNTWVILF